MAERDLRLDEDGTCSASTRTAGRETPVTENDCTWTSEGATIWLVTDDGENLTGTVANGELTITNEGNVLVFVRR